MLNGDPDVRSSFPAAVTDRCKRADAMSEVRVVTRNLKLGVSAVRPAGRYRPQFHIGPMGVCVQHGPKPPPFQRPR